MKIDACVRGILGEDADSLTDEELSGLIADLQRRKRMRQAQDASLDDVTALRGAADEVAADLELAAKVEKRNAALNILRHKEATAFIDGFNDPARGLEALLAGSNKRIEGARLSVDSRTRAREGRYLGGMVNDLKREGLLQFVQARFFARGKGPLDDKIAIELYELRDGGSPGSSGSREAQKIAAIVHKYQELARADQNRAGAFIRKLPGYIVSQSHDMFRIRRAGKDKWIASILPLLDGDRTFDGADPLKFLSGVYDELASGTFYKADAEAPLIGFKGPANLAKKVSQSRVLHFRDAESWVAYNDGFGMGGIMDAVAFGLKHAARNVALMETLGTNPRAMFNRLVSDAKQAAIGDTKQSDKLRSGRLEGMMNVADGTVDIPASVSLARFGSFVRAYENIVKLGGAVLSSIPDIATAAADIQFRGKSFLSGMRDQIGGFFNAIPDKSVRREVAERIGAAIDGKVGAILSRFSAADTLPGRMAKLQQNFFRLNLLGWWTDAHEAGFAAGMAHDLARQAEQPLDALHPRAQVALGLYDIGAKEWDVLRAYGVETAADGRAYVLPDVVRNAPDEAIATLVTGKVTPGKVKAARDGLEEKLRAYYLDRTSYGVLKGGIRERFASTQGRQAGDPMGEAARFFGLFRNYSVSFVNKAFGRYAETDTFWSTPGGLARMPWGEKRQAAQLILAMTALGYVSMSLKQITKGQEPPDPTDRATWGQAFLQGGGAGIYGDFLTADFNRFGGGGLETLAGPVVGSASDLLRLYGAMQDWATGKTENAPDAQAFNIFKNNTPFLNLFYVRAALDYLILYDVQEAISPGSLRRMERRLKKEQGKEFILRPSEDRLRPVT